MVGAGCGEAALEPVTEDECRVLAAMSFVGLVDSFHLVKRKRATRWTSTTADPPSGDEYVSTSCRMC